MISRLIRQSIILISLMILSPKVLSQTQFRHPMNIPMAPSGTFGEARGNHFHSGIDLRIGGQVGEPVYAPADGYVSRLRISSSDGGKMLYINHAGGLTTVYLHLDRYAGAIARKVRECQYEKQTFVLDTNLNSTVLRVKKGDLIAYAGNSGASGGPHLHYEVRTTSTQRSLNPLKYGITLVDTIAPVIRGVRLLPAQQHTVIAGSHQGYNLPNNQDTVALDGRFYLGVYATDASEGSTLRNGYDRLDVWVDGKAFFQYSIDSLTYSDTRAMNLQMDYAQFLANRQMFIVTRRLPGDPTRHVRVIGDGTLSFSDTLLHRITIKVTDYNGNSALRRFYVVNRPQQAVDEPRKMLQFADQDTIFYHRVFKSSGRDYQITIPAHTLYANDVIGHTPTSDSRFLSAVHSVRPRESIYPPHKTWYLRLPVPYGQPLDKLLIVQVDGKRIVAAPSKVDGQWLEASLRAWGAFAVTTDLAAPTVKPVNFKQGKAVKGSTLTLRIGDNLSGVRTYRCYLNGQWVLAECDGKSSSLTINLNDLDSRVILHGQNNELRVILTDGCNNTTDVTYSVLIR